MNVGDALIVGTFGGLDWPESWTTTYSNVSHWNEAWESFPCYILKEAYILLSLIEQIMYYSSSFFLFQLLRRHNGANHKPWLACQSCSINSRCVSHWNISPLISSWFIPLDFVRDSSVTIMHLACFRGLGKTASHSRERQHRDYLSPSVSGMANGRHSTCKVIRVNSNDCSDWYRMIMIVSRIFLSDLFSFEQTDSVALELQTCL